MDDVDIFDTDPASAMAGEDALVGLPTPTSRPEPQLALYRRYRPETFAEVIGQEHVTEPLMRALTNNRVNHAYLFSGPRGCGKTTSARILARALNCENGPTPVPCGQCRSCRDLARGGSGSIDVIEIDAASHGGVEDARGLRESAFFVPVQSRYKIYIVDEAHMVTTAGFNAMLKVVEEPPAHVKFIFATTEPDKVIGTIRSRTHHYPFRLVPPRTLGSYLADVCAQEGIVVESAVLPLVVRAGAGSVRDSLSVLDQLLGAASESGVAYADAASLLGFTPDSLLDEIVDAFAAGDGAGVFACVDKVIDVGQDPKRFAEDLLRRLRDLIVVGAVPDALSSGLVDVAADQGERYQAQAAALGQGELTRAAEVLAKGLTEMRGTTSPRLYLELMCSRVLLPGADVDGRGIHARIERIERRLHMVSGDDLATEPVLGQLSEPRPATEATAPPSQGWTRAVGQPASPTAGGGPQRPRATTDSGQDRPHAVAGGSGSGFAGAGGAEVGGGRSQGPRSAGEAAGRMPVEGAQLVTEPSDAAARRPVSPTGSAVGSDQPTGSAAANDQPTPDNLAAQPSAGQPVTSQAIAESTQPDGPATPGSKDPSRFTTADLRRLWPEVLEEVKRRRRYTWILLSQNAQILTVDEDLLILAFANQGAREGFLRGDSADLLRQALSRVIGIVMRIDTTVDSRAVQEGREGAGERFAKRPPPADSRPASVRQVELTNQTPPAEATVPQVVVGAEAIQPAEPGAEAEPRLEERVLGDHEEAYLDPATESERLGVAPRKETAPGVGQPVSAADLARLRPVVNRPSAATHATSAPDRAPEINLGTATSPTPVTSSSEGVVTGSGVGRVPDGALAANVSQAANRPTAIPSQAPTRASTVTPNSPNAPLASYQSPRSGPASEGPANHHWAQAAKQRIQPVRDAPIDPNEAPEEIPDRADPTVETSGETEAELLRRHLDAELIGEEPQH